MDRVSERPSGLGDLRRRLDETQLAIGWVIAKSVNSEHVCQESPTPLRPEHMSSS